MNSNINKYNGKIKVITLLVITAVIGICLVLPQPVEAHLEEDVGESGQLYSYYLEGPNKPVIDGFFDSAGGGGNSEWAQAYVRIIKMTNLNFSKEINANLFLMNDAEYIYVGLSYVYENSGNNNNFVELFFDEGNGGLDYDGDHDDILTGSTSVPNENGMMCKKEPTTKLIDYCWNGTSWITDGDFSTDFEAEVDGDIVSTQLNYEFKIPLNSKDDNSLASDLNVGAADELGILIHARLQGQTISFTDYYWSMTNMNTTDASSWGDLKLGVKSSDLTMFSTYAVNGEPFVDGDISNDFSWADSYERDMIFTNFNGSKLNVKLYLTEDPEKTFVYIGVVVYDSKSSLEDRIFIHFEQNYTTLPASQRDYIMDANKENLLTVSKGDAFTDGKFTASGGIASWIEDTTDPLNENQTGAVNYYLSPNRYEFEFRLNYTAAEDGFQTEDLCLAQGALVGMQIQYFDGNGGDFPNYWWEYNGNTNATLIDKNNNVFLAMGYSLLQIGGPAIKLITPQDGGIVSGNTYDFKIMAVDENSNGVAWCGFKLQGEISWTSLIKDSSSDIWSTNWDTTAFNNGIKTITIVAQDDDGIAVRRYLQVQVSNVGTGTAPVITTFDLKPSEPQPIAGNSVEFTAEANSVDGVKFYAGSLWLGDMNDVGGGIFEYVLDSTLLSDGSHLFRAVAHNIYGEVSLSKSYTVDNWNLVSNPIDDPGIAISGVYTFIVRPNPSEDADYSEFYIDNILYGMDDSLSTGKHQFSIDTTILSDGFHISKAITYDRDGIFVMSFLNFEIDNWHPVISINSPVDGSIVSDTVTISASGTDLVSVSYYLDNTLMGTINTAGPWNIQVDTTKFSDGSYLFHLIGYDRDSNTVMDTITLWINNDIIGPDCTIVNPLPNEIIYNDLWVRVYADDLSGVKTIILYLDNGLGLPMAHEIGSSYYLYYIPILSLSPGNHTLKATAYDINDNGASSITISFFNGLEDTDSDLIPDIVDKDIDGDGIRNDDDDFPYDPSEWIDTDEDSIGNNADEDDDNDGWSDILEEQYGTDSLNPSIYPLDIDSDGIPDTGDNDIDGDGVINANDAFPYDVSEWSDLDDDGIGDNSDVDIDGDKILNDIDYFPYDNTECSYLDSDGIGDNSDEDIDGDGILNTKDKFPKDGFEWNDSDGDGIGDNSDNDIDGDGVLNANDVFPFDPNEWSDLDGDLKGDNTDDDIDNDGVANTQDAFPLDANEWSDLDGDDIGDNHDDDIDGDGILNHNDAFPFDYSESNDLDGDGIGDDSDDDIDGDGINNINDAFPEIKTEWYDSDEDGVGDNCDNDIDGDDVQNINDAFPYDPYESVDTDGDGIGNKADKDDDNDGVPDSEDLAPLSAAIGRADYTWLAIPLVIVILYIVTVIILMVKRIKENRSDKKSEKIPTIKLKKIEDQKIPTIKLKKIEDQKIP